MKMSFDLMIISKWLIIRSNQIIERICHKRLAAQSVESIRVIETLTGWIERRMDPCDREQRLGG